MDQLIISFDLDGTLFEYSFPNAIWFEAIPKLYAKNQKISFKEALDKVKKEYDRIGDEEIEWYDINYWLNKFRINCDPIYLLNQYRDRVKLYNEVLEIIKNIALNYNLIINSNSPREFMNIQLEESKIEPFFKYVFSSISDFKLLKKTPLYYEKVCRLLEVVPEKIIHVGDNWKFDFIVPKKVGIQVIFLDRSGLKNGTYIIHNLKELDKVLSKF